jgi:hypothetical protein
VERVEQALERMPEMEAKIILRAGLAETFPLRTVVIDVWP